jgi:lipoic acid synthetase
MPEEVNKNEPDLIAKAVKELGLDYVVITSVTRDDLEDGGAGHFAKTIRAIKNISSDIKVEVLTPDFQGDINAINTVIKAKPDVFNHNIETVKRLYPTVRPQAEYQRSLDLINYIKSVNPEIYTKSGLMVGLGEEFDEIKETLRDLNNHNCDIVTVGQYIQPTNSHLKVHRYLTPDEFGQIKQMAIETGIKYPISAPLVRSSYKANEVICGS